MILEEGPQYHLPELRGRLRIRTPQALAGEERDSGRESEVRRGRTEGGGRRRKRNSYGCWVLS